MLEHIVQMTLLHYTRVWGQSSEVIGWFYVCVCVCVCVCSPLDTRKLMFSMVTTWANRSTSHCRSMK